MADESTVVSLQLQALLAERENVAAYGQYGRLSVIDEQLEGLGWVSPEKRAAAAAAERKAAAKAAADKGAEAVVPAGRSKPPQVTADSSKPQEAT